MPQLKWIYRFYYYDDGAKAKKYQSYINKCKKNNVPPSATLEDFLNIKTMKDLLSCSFIPAGHAFVIKALLQGDLEVLDDVVIDRGGLLSLLWKRKLSSRDAADSASKASHL